MTRARATGLAESPGGGGGGGAGRGGEGTGKSRSRRRGLAGTVSPPPPVLAFTARAGDNISFGGPTSEDGRTVYVTRYVTLWLSRSACVPSVYTSIRYVTGFFRDIYRPNYPRTSILYYTSIIRDRSRKSPPGFVRSDFYVSRVLRECVRRNYYIDVQMRYERGILSVNAAQETCSPGHGMNDKIHGKIDVISRLI